MSNYFNPSQKYKELAKKENHFNYNIASLGDIYRPYLESPKKQRQYDILSEEEMYSKGLIRGKSNIGYKKYPKSNIPIDKNMNNVNINQVDLSKGLSKNINLNQGKSQGILKGHKITTQRQTSAISTKKIKYNQDLDPAQKNRIMDVNYLHLSKLPESKKFSHVDKAIINPIQSNFSVKDIVDDNIKKHEKMMRPIVLYPDPVKIYNEQPDKTKYLPGALRNSQDRYRGEYDNKINDKKNTVIIGQNYNNQNKNKDNHVIFEPPKESKYRKKATSTKSARKTLRDSENFVDALENYFLSTDLKVRPKYDIKTILNNYAIKLEESLNNYEKAISGKKKMNDDISKFLYKTMIAVKSKKKYNIKRSKKPRISEIDYDFKKKIQERLCRLQINLRQIFDNISILKKNKTKHNIEKINEQIHKARELTNYVKHLATDIENGEEEFKKSYMRNESAGPKKNRKNLNQKNNMSYSLNNSTNILPQNNTSFSRTMNNFNHPNINLDNNNNNMSKTNPHIENNNNNNQLEYSTSSIGSNINPINSFSSENKNINPKVSFAPQGQSQNSTLMNSKANLYMKSNNINPIIEESNEDVNYNTSNQTNIIIYPSKKTNNQNSNYFLQSTNSFKEIKDQNPKLTQKNINANNKNNINPITKPVSINKSKTNENSKMITVSLAEPSYFKQKSMTSKEFSGTRSISLSNPRPSDVLTQSGVINNIDQTINHVPMKDEEMKVNTQNYIEDERYSAFNVEFPVKYYYELTREHEPPKNKEWFLRPHHTETFVESKKAIPDDIMNTKYISYYAPSAPKTQKSRQDVIEELIMETRERINELQEDLFKKSNMDSEGEKLYSKLEGLKEEAKKSFIPGYRDAKEAKQKNIFEMLKDPNSGASYTEMFDQNDDIKQTNYAISSVGTMLNELRDKERDLINIKRQQEYERIRPPIDRWYELKGDNFLNEIIRNKMVLNSGPEYFQKIDELQNDELY